jgi:LmbE family N-acetylglucosaminyl deacetylase
MKLLLAPHNDDEALYCAFTIMRLKPLVVIVTDSAKHLQRYGITAQERRSETIEAMKILGATVLFLGIPDDNLTEEVLSERLKHLDPEMVFAPAIQGGNADHDTVGKVADNLWGDKVKHYATYTREDPVPSGNSVVIPTAVEISRKHEALKKYPTQLKVNGMYFISVMGKPEYYV